MENKKLLSYEQVSIAYNGQLVVKDISFSVAAGEILGLVGPSGCGKSTLLKAAMDLLGPAGEITQGRIEYAGSNLMELEEDQCRLLYGAEIGMIFQHAGSSFCPVRTIEAQLYEAVTAHRPMTKAEFKEQTLALFTQLGLERGEELLCSYPFQLSGGMQQRVGIAASMLLRPRLLLADEPSSALDALTQRQVMEELQQVRSKFGTAIILVSHNIGLVGAMADRLLVMEQGAIVERGNAKEVLAKPKSAYTKALLAAKPRQKARR